MSQSPSRTTEDINIKVLRKPILIAGLLGGFLGGVLSIAGARFIKPATVVPPPTAKEKAIEEARHVVEAFLAEINLDKEKKDDFMTHVKLGYTYLSNEDYLETKKGSTTPG